MKILPDYLIQYMPEIEEALEELRLSVLDHAYELLQRLDIDELTVDEVRQKLELYDISVDNMTSEWLPNGRFYRLYPSIKHHRSRHNAIKAIAKSGGQFEGLWSNDFSNKSAYNFNKIQVARHYELESDADGYFFVSGDTVKNAKGQVISSAAQALTTDILINQALPAGYTYLYIPWPRPIYPGDANYFYNVHMLMHDRLHYANDCDHRWLLYRTEGRSSIYYCEENSSTNRYCKVNKTTRGTLLCKYCEDPNNTIVSEDNPSAQEWHEFDSSVKGDEPFCYELYDEDLPASTRYDWKYGTNTPWHTPYWIDYHYMNKMSRSLPGVDDNGNKSAGTWPVQEYGSYYDEDDDPCDPEEAVRYSLADECKELADSHSVFPTKCYIKGRYKTSEPNRLQKFTPNSIVLTINSYEIDRTKKFFEFLCSTLHKSEEDIIYNITDSINFTQINEVVPVGDSSYEKIKRLVLDDTEDQNGTYILSFTYRLRFTNSDTDESYFDDIFIYKIVDFADGVYEWNDTQYYRTFNILKLRVGKTASEINFNITEQIADDFEKNIESIKVSSAVESYNQRTNSTEIGNLSDDKQQIDVGSGFMSISDFYEADWIMAKSTKTVYYGEDSFDVYYDDLSDHYGYDVYYGGCDYTIDYSHEDSIDSNDSTEPDRILLDEHEIDTNIPPAYDFQLKAGAYRWDKLYDGYAFRLRETIDHFREFRPFWCENTLWSAMMSNGNKFIHALSLEDRDVENHSLYYWMHLYQDENRPQLANITGPYVEYYEGVVRNNEPPVSDITFTSHCRLTRGKLDPVYVGYFTDNIDDLFSNSALNTNVNSLYVFNAFGETESEPQEDPVGMSFNSELIEIDLNEPLENDSEEVTPVEVISYDPEYYYTAINLNYIDSRNNQLYKANHLVDGLYNSEDIYAGFIGDPYARTLELQFVENSNHNKENDKYLYNYITFKKSNIHKLWFSSSHEDADILLEHHLYNFQGSNSIYKFSYNGVNIKYSILEVYDENNKPLNCTSGQLECYITNEGSDLSRYEVVARQLESNGVRISKAAYILFTVDVKPGTVRQEISTSISSRMFFTTGIKSSEYYDISSIAEYEYHEPGVNGSHYQTEDFLVDTLITGGHFETYDVEVISNVAGNHYETVEFEVDTRFEGGYYETEDVLVYNPVNGSHYETVEFEVEVPQPVSGGLYETEEFLAETQISGGLYETEEFLTDAPLSGGEYDSTPIDVEHKLSGGEYDSNPINVEPRLNGGEYESQPINVDSRLLGGNYDSTPIDVEGKVSGGEYNSDPINVDHI